MSYWSNGSYRALSEWMVADEMNGRSCRIWRKSASSMERTALPSCRVEPLRSWSKNKDWRIACPTMLPLTSPISAYLGNEANRMNTSDHGRCYPNILRKKERNVSEHDHTPPYAPCLLPQSHASHVPVRTMLTPSKPGITRPRTHHAYSLKVTHHTSPYAPCLLPQSQESHATPRSCQGLT